MGTGGPEDVAIFGRAMRRHFLFGPKWVNLNHGSFGTYPVSVRNALRACQEMTETAPDKFLFYQYAELLDKSRELVAALLNAPVDDCVFVLNATTGVNTVLRNLTWEPKDAIIYFDTVYSAVEKSLFSLRESNPQIHLRRVGQGEECSYSLPASHSEILNVFTHTVSRLASEGYRPKLAIFDTIVSLPGARFPFEGLTKLCREHGILSLVDGAHGIGHIPLDLTALDPDFFISNCHKWLYTPRGSAVFFVPKRNQHLLRTTIPTSHGYIPPPGLNIRRVLPPAKKSDFVNLFQFVGTADNAPFYCVPAAMDFRAKVCGGEQAIYEYIRHVAQTGADLLAKLLGTKVMDELDQSQRLEKTGNTKDDDGVGGPNPWAGGIRDCALANVLLPLKIVDSRESRSGETHSSETGYHLKDDDRWSKLITIQRDDVQKHIDWLHSTMTEEFNTRVLVYEYKQRVWTRVSGQIYLDLNDFEWLGGVLKGLCERVGLGDSLRDINGVSNGVFNRKEVAAVGGGIEKVQLKSSPPQ